MISTPTLAVNHGHDLVHGFGIGDCLLGFLIGWEHNQRIVNVIEQSVEIVGGLCLSYPPFGELLHLIHMFIPRVDGNTELVFYLISIKHS